MTTRTLSLLIALAALLSPSSAAADPGWRWPVRGEVLTPYRNGDDPYAGGQHRGIDIAAPVGAPVAAATAGTVRFAGLAGDNGLTVAIRTADGRFDTSYLHLESIGVRAGSAVSAGERIGAVGTSGRRSVVAPHLHFGVREAGERFAYRDPLSLLPPPGAPEPRPVAPRAVPVVALEPQQPALAAALAAVAAPPPVPVAVPLPAAAGLLGSAAAPLGSPAAALGSPAAALGSPAAAPALTPIPSLAHAPASLRPAAHRAPGSAPAPGSGAQGTSHPARARASEAGRAAPVTRPPGSAAAADSGRASRPEPVAGHGGGPRGSDGPARGGPPAGARFLAVHRHPTAAPRSRGLDLGWLAACVGLVAAAMLLGRPRGPLATLRRARSFSPPRRPALRERA
jgi:hypothetical protein